jgi:gas vesicle protein
MRRDNEISFIWFLAGLSLGALVGVLFAPRSGQETRDAIKDTAEEGAECIKNLGRDARESVNTWVERGKEAIDQQRETLGSAIEVGREAYREATGESNNSAAAEGRSA